MKLFIVLSCLVAVGLADKFRIRNNCPFTVWPGILGNSGKGQPENGGFELPAGQSRDVQVGGDWGGRVWGRTGCQGGHCQTGDCGNKIQCAGAGGAPPATLAEITFKGAGGLDFYDVSLVDGYNLPIKMTPIGGTFKITKGGHYDCTGCGCNADLNARCPAELQVKEGGATIACMSACEKFNTDQYCCRGQYGTPDKCKSSQWPVDYSKIFKGPCPDAYSYAYDDSTSTFTCMGNPNTDYEILFCP